MYAKLSNGYLEEFNGTCLRYTKTENGTMYYVQIINPTETDFNDAGYYRVILPEEDDGKPFIYELIDNCIVRRVTDEKAMV